MQQLLLLNSSRAGQFEQSSQNSVQTNSLEKEKKLHIFRFGL